MPWLTARWLGIGDHSFMTVNEREKIVAEIRQLLDEQMEALRMELTPEMVLEYTERKQKIRKLVDQVASPDRT